MRTEEWNEIIAKRSLNATPSKGDIRSQNATASKRNIRFMPYAFTEHGAIMAANVLNSERAVEMIVSGFWVLIIRHGLLAKNQ